mmetsp:Transcript_9221/g.25800  ORF Transcript_9221/g.25800 Transcript_9221/m.25800 type:complete len:218 (-) Transcript_9221:18-671(-)
MAEPGARSTLLVEAAASASGVESRASGVHVATEPLFGILGACEVGLRCFRADASVLVDPLIRSILVAAIAGSSRAAIQKVLNGRIDINSFAAPCNLHPVCKGRCSSMSPAGATILGDVLITAHGAVIDTILVAPSEVIWVRGRSHQQFMRAVIGRVCPNPPACCSHLLISPPFIHAPHICTRKGNRCNAQLHNICDHGCPGTGVCARSDTQRNFEGV